MKINEVHDFINYIHGKERGGFISPEEIDSNLDRAQMVKMDRDFKSYGLTQKLQDSLAPFKTSFQFSTSSTPSGVLTMPTDYLYLLNAVVTRFDNSTQKTKNLKVQLVNEDELADALESRVRPLNLNRLLGIVSGKGKIQLYPASSHSGTVMYLRRPVAPYYAYSLQGRVVTYNEPNSRQLEWNDVDILDIILIALQYSGINLDNDKVLQYGLKNDK